jgi:hypothetical protein
MKIDQTDQRGVEPEQGLRGRRPHALDAEAEREDERQRRENDRPLQRAHEHHVADMGEEDVTALHHEVRGRRNDAARAHHVGRICDRIGDRQQVDTERGRAGDREPDDHVVVDPQHVGAQARVDDGRFGLRDRSAEARNVAIEVRHRRNPLLSASACGSRPAASLHHHDRNLVADKTTDFLSPCNGETKPATPTAIS